MLEISLVRIVTGSEDGALDIILNSDRSVEPELVSLVISNCEVEPELMNAVTLDCET